MNPLTGAKATAEFFRGHEILGPQENFMVVSLDSRLRPIQAPWLAGRGTLDSVAVAPRDVFREAVRLNAAAVILAHNHPSEDPSPSAQDLAMTERLVQAGELLGIPVIDHVIICKSTCLSLAERGDIELNQKMHRRWAAER